MRTISARYRAALTSWERNTRHTAISARLTAGDLSGLAGRRPEDIRALLDHQMATVRALRNRTVPRALARPRKRIDVRNQLGDTEVYLYEEIGWFGITAADFVPALADIRTSTLTLRVNSPGGDVFDGIAIYNALVDHPARVTVQVDGFAASIASVITMAGNRVVMGRGAEMMIHDPWAACVGNTADMTAMASTLNQVGDNLADIYADRAGGTPADWRTAMLAETWYRAEQAVKAGLADEVQTRQQADTAAALAHRRTPAGRGRTLDADSVAALTALAPDPTDALLALASPRRK